MSGVTNQMRYYWLDELKAEIIKKAEQVKKDGGRPDYEVEVSRHARNAVLAEHGVLDIYDELEELSDQIQELVNRKKAINLKINQALGQPEYRDSMYIQSDYMIPEVMAMDPVGRKLLELKELERTMERDVYLQTSEAKLAEYVQQFLDKLAAL